MKIFDPAEFGPVFAALLAGDRRRPLDAGRPNSQLKPTLDRLTIDTAFAGSSIRDHDAAECCRAGIWLLHDFLDESHTISQRIDTPEGSYWHAIMHRREGDFSNAKYWYRRVDGHPALGAVKQRLAELAYNRALGTQSAMMKATTDRAWDPFEFVNLCEFAVREKSYTQESCLDMQQAEWETLFDYCYRGAVGSGLDPTR